FPLGIFAIVFLIFSNTDSPSVHYLGTLAYGEIVPLRARKFCRVLPHSLTASTSPHDVKAPTAVYDEE
ncbi:MAG: hypothetical protein ACXU9O_16110, partial [Gemmatimonadaceae bacterium]